MTRLTAREDSAAAPETGGAVLVLGWSAGWRGAATRRRYFTWHVRQNALFWLSIRSDFVLPSARIVPK